MNILRRSASPMPTLGPMELDRRWGTRIVGLSAEERETLRYRGELVTRDDAARKAALEDGADGWDEAGSAGQEDSGDCR